jgi:hypothetical protein
MTRTLKQVAFVAAFAAVSVMVTAEADAGAFARRTYYAAVDAGGAPARGVTGVKSVRTSTGHYTVTFRAKVNTCAYVGTVGVATPSTKPVTNAGGAVAQITPVAGKPGSLFVITSKQGKPTNLGYYLIATC